MKQALSGTVTFKAKPREDGTFLFKKRITKADCCTVLKRHPLVNTDIFEGIVNKAYKKTLDALPQRTCANINDLPDGVKIENNGFLITVTVDLKLN